jgi:hypothetical protein
MAGLIQPECGESPEYRGLPAIFEYTNWDGRLVRTNCGQAAAATFLTHHRKLPPDVQRAREVLAQIEREHPPDNVGGAFGTSRRRVVRICIARGLRVEPISGEEALRARLENCHPVVVMLGVCGGKLFGRFNLPGGHWMVAYGFDREFVHLTNHGRMTWAEFLQGWDGFVPRLIGMQRKGLVLAQDLSPSMDQ